MRPRAISAIPSLSRSYVTRPSRLSKPPTGFQGNNAPSNSTSSSSSPQQHILTKVTPASAPSVYDYLDQIPPGNSPILYSDQTRSRQAELSSDQLAQLQEQRQAGKSVTQLSKEFNVSRSFVMQQGFPRTTEGEAARSQREKLRQAAQRAQRSRWGWNKWYAVSFSCVRENSLKHGTPFRVTWDVRRAKRELW